MVVLASLLAASSGLQPIAQSFGLSTVIVALLVGLGLGGLLGALLASVGPRTRLRVAEDRLRRAEPAVAEVEELRERLAGERARREADVERLAWIHTADEQLRMSFDSLARGALRESAGELTERAGELSDRSDERLRGLVEPLQRALDGLETNVRTLEKERRGDVDALRREIGLLRDAHRALRTSAEDLRRALASPGGRGRWGEIQLRRLVEMAGLVEHVDFEEQPTVEGGLRPDLVVRLPGGGALPVDAKTPLSDYLAAAEEPESATPGAATRGTAALDRHVRALRSRTAELGGKAYWKALGTSLGESPDFVVMFLPHEGALSAAFARDPSFLDFALEQRVLPATPVTLLGLLKAVGWTWRRQSVAREAETIAAAGRELHGRLSLFLEHLGRVGRSLDGAVDAFNRSVGSLERRVLPAARRLEQSSAAPEPLTEPAQIERGVRSVG